MAVLLSLLALASALGVFSPAAAPANTSHAGWPPITGMLLINKLDQARPLDGRPGDDPFDGTDYSNSCERCTTIVSHNQCPQFHKRFSRLLQIDLVSNSHALAYLHG